VSARLTYQELGLRGRDRRLLQRGIEAVNKAVPDIAIIDLRLPDGDGMELLSLIREQHPQVDAVILTGMPPSISAIDAIRKGRRIIGKTQ
jgi:ActR/RegA family two-component response regulator